MGDYWSFPDPHRCHKCGKEVYIRNVHEWVYKRPQGNRTDDDTKYFCSWKCLRAYDKAMGED